MEVAAVDGNLGFVDVTGEVVAAIEVVHQVLAVEFEVGGVVHIRAPATAVEREEGRVIGGVGLDVGVLHVAAHAAAVGRGRFDVGGVVEVDVGGFGDVTPALALEVAGVEVVPAAFAATEE